jgi:hypothetical protein
VVGFFSSRPKWAPPPPHPQVSVFPTPLVVVGEGGGGTHSLAGEGVGESPFRRGDRHCGILGLFVLCGSGSSTVKVQTAPLLCQ